VADLGVQRELPVVSFNSLSRKDPERRHVAQEIAFISSMSAFKTNNS
jgi:hypothetical protein